MRPARAAVTGVIEEFVSSSTVPQVHARFLGVNLGAESRCAVSPNPLRRVSKVISKFVILSGAL